MKRAKNENKNQDKRVRRKRLESVRASGTAGPSKGRRNVGETDKREGKRPQTEFSVCHPKPKERQKEGNG